MIGSQSHLYDLMGTYYFTLASRDLGNVTLGPVQIASGLQNLNDVGTDYQLPYPEKSAVFTFYMKTSAAITAGTVTLETTVVPGYTGTWHAMVNRNFTGGTQAAHSFYNAIRGPLLTVRARVTNAIVGGTIDVFFMGSANTR